MLFYVMSNRTFTDGKPTGTKQCWGFPKTAVRRSEYQSCLFPKRLVKGCIDADRDVQICTVAFGSAPRNSSESDGAANRPVGQRLNASKLRLFLFLYETTIEEQYALGAYQ